MGICTGGTCGYTLNAYSAHGGNNAEGRLQVDGMSNQRFTPTAANAWLTPTNLVQPRFARVQV